MLVSIIIPTYNRLALLTEAIQSVISQTYRPIECIVVDDGSTDNTKGVVDKLAKELDNDVNLIYLNQNNAGSQAARNKGTAAATGELIQYLDSDDLLYPDKIARQVEYFQLHPGCDAVFGDWETGTIEKKEKIVAYRSDDLIAQFLTEKCIANFAMLMRTPLVKKIGDWDVNIKRNQEIDFHLRGVLAGGIFEYQPGLCGLWRTHAKDRIVNVTGLEATIHFFEKWEKILLKKKLLTVNLAEKLGNMYLWLVGQNLQSDTAFIMTVLYKIKKLNPSIATFNSRKIRLLTMVLGEKRALRYWIHHFRKKTSLV